MLAPVWWRRAGRLDCLLAQRVIRNSRDAALADAEDVVELAGNLDAADLGQPRHLRPEDDGARDGAISSIASAPRSPSSSSYDAGSSGQGVRLSRRMAMTSSRFRQRASSGTPFQVTSGWNHPAASPRSPRRIASIQPTTASIALGFEGT